MSTNIKEKIVEPGLSNRWQVVQIALLGIWVLFQYSRGNELYAIFMLFLFISLSIFHLKNFTIIAVSIFVIILFKTPVLDTWTEIKDSNLYTFQSFKPSISKLFTPDSGKDILPSDVRKMLSLLQENKITKYQLCNSFEFDPLINQRIVESAWPIRKEVTSRYLLCPTEEVKNMTACTEIARQKDVSLAYCP